VTARQLALVVTIGPGQGALSVSWKGTVLQQVDLPAATTTNQVLVVLPAFSTAQTGTVTLTVTSADLPVIVDGLGAFT
jgi:hypothetical protein